MADKPVAGGNCAFNEKMLEREKTINKDFRKYFMVTGLVVKNKQLYEKTRLNHFLSWANFILNL